MSGASDHVIPGVRVGGRAAAFVSLLKSPAWVASALCGQTDPDSFFPEKGISPKQQKQTCSRCPVLEQCRKSAIDNREPYGIWGGMTPDERRAVWALEDYRRKAA